jgi:hypothetical protein
MLTVTFAVALALFLLAAGVFSLGLARLARNDPRAGDTLSLGFAIGLSGVVAAAIIFGFFG